jgi:hypothetical protein
VVDDDVGDRRAVAGAERELRLAAAEHDDRIAGPLPSASTT